MEIHFEQTSFSGSLKILSADLTQDAPAVVVNHLKIAVQNAQAGRVLRSYLRFGLFCNFERLKMMCGRRTLASRSLLEEDRRYVP